MAATIRFRPLILGEPPERGEIWYLCEREDGRVVFRDAESPWLLDKAVSLDWVDIGDLPDYYMPVRSEMQLLAVRAARGETDADAYDDLLRQIEALHNDVGDRATLAEAAA